MKLYIVQLFFLMILLINTKSNGLNDRTNSIDQDLNNILNSFSQDFDDKQYDTSDQEKNSKKPHLLVKKTKETTQLLTTIPVKIESNSHGSEQTNQHSSQWTMFFILCILGISIILIHILIETHFHYLPESVAVVFLGALIGLLFKLLSFWNIADWSVSKHFILN
jgi:hypothetical protein